MNERVIERWFPIKSVGIEGQKEKTVAIGRIPSIHQHHARRPTCAARAIILASLLEFSPEEKRRKDHFKLIQSYGLRNIPRKIHYNGVKTSIIEVIQSEFTEHGIDPKLINVFDPFSGGGTFPLEARNLGLNVYTSDLNPVSVLIELATCYYPQKFGKKLVQELDRYYHKVQKILENEIGEFFANIVHPKNHINFFVWTRQVKCRECNLIIPLIKNFTLSKKYKWALIPLIPETENDNEIKFSIGWPNKTNGYLNRGKVSCPRCKMTFSKDIIIKAVSENIRDRLLVVYEDLPKRNSKARGSFRFPTSIELQKATLNWEKIKQELIEEFPDIDLKFERKSSIFRIQNYGIDSVSKCFNGHQLCTMKAILQAIVKIKDEIIKTHPDSEFQKALMLYLSLGLSKMSDYNSNLTTLYATTSPRISNVWARPILFMKGFPYVEVNPLKTDSTGGWLLYFNSLKRVLNNLIEQPQISGGRNSIQQMDAMELEYPDESMDFCFTDPPYYDNVAYAASSDYFYAWLKASLNSFFPELLFSSSTPKNTEIIQDNRRHGGTEEAKHFYERGMAQAFSEIYRVLKYNSLAVIVFAHKDAKAWETLLQAILDSKFVITNTWPLLMESSSPMRSKDVVSLDSVILLVCRKRSRKGQKYFDEQFRQELDKKIRKKLERQWKLGFRGADFFLSAIGPAIEEFSQFKAVLDVKNDKSVKLKEYLLFVDKILVRFSLGKVLSKEETSTDALTQLYLIWRSAYKLALLPYDEVWKFTNALGLDEKKFEGIFVKKVRVKSKIAYQCLDAISKTEMFKKKTFTPSCLIEALQYAGFLWGENNPSLEDVIAQSRKKYGSEFWHVAQAICNLTPDAPEVRLFSGLLRKYGMKQKKKPEKKSPDLQSYLNKTVKRSKEEQ